MAITKEEVAQRSRQWRKEQRDEEIRQLEHKIDQCLMQYKKGGEVQVPFEEKISDNIIETIKRTYREKRWTVQVEKNTYFYCEVRRVLFTFS